MKRIILVFSMLVLSACATQRIVLPPEVFKQEMTQVCEPQLAQLQGKDGKAVMVTFQLWHESYRQCEALNNSKAQYMLKLQEIFKQNNKLFAY